MQWSKSVHTLMDFHTSYIGKMRGNIVVSDEECHTFGCLPFLKPWGLSCHWHIWTAMKMPKTVLLLGLPTLSRFYDFTVSRGVLLICILVNDVRLAVG